MPNLNFAGALTNLLNGGEGCGVPTK